MGGTVGIIAIIFKTKLVLHYMQRGVDESMLAKITIRFYFKHPSMVVPMLD